MSATQTYITTCRVRARTGKQPPNLRGRWLSGPPGRGAGGKSQMNHSLKYSWDYRRRRRGFWRAHDGHRPSAAQALGGPLWRCNARQNFGPNGLSQNCCGLLPHCLRAHGEEPRLVPRSRLSMSQASHAHYPLPSRLNCISCALGPLTNSTCYLAARGHENGCSASTHSVLAEHA